MSGRGEVIPSFRISLTRDEIEAVEAPLVEGNLCTGTEVSALEHDFGLFLHQRHAVATSTGTAALHLSLLGLGVGAGREVIMPSYVCSAVLNAVRYVRATPAVCDIVLDRFLMDRDRMRELAGAGTGAIIVPEMFGYRADLDLLEGIEIPVLLDRAMSLGSEGGGNGRNALSVFSFFATKVITAGQGGLIATDDDDIARTVRDLRAYDKKADGRLRYNYTLTDFQAALARRQLAHLAARTERRREIVRRYMEGVANPLLRLPPAPKGWNGQRFIVRCPEGADGLIRHLRRHGVTAVRPVYEPAHRLLGLDRSRFPVTERIWAEAAAVPCYPDLTAEEVTRVIEALNAFRGDD